MIPTIGVMIGAYTITRLVAHVARPGEWGSRILAIVAILVIAFCTFSLLLSGATPTTPMH